MNGARATGKKEGIPYFSYDNNQGSNERESEKQNEAQFRMLDAGPEEAPLQMINTKGPVDKGFKSLTQQGAALRNNPGLSEE